MSQSFFLLAIIEFVDAHMSRQLFPGVLTVLTGKRFTQQRLVLLFARGMLLSTEGNSRSTNTKYK